MPAAGMGGESIEDLSDALYEEEYEEQEESGAYPEEGMEQVEEEIPLEEELMVDMDVVSDGWRGMQPNEKREQIDVALAKEADEEYQRQMAEYQEALEASENRIKNTQAEIDQTLTTLRNENNQMQKDVTSSLREVEGVIRGSEKDLRDQMKVLETDLSRKLQEALDNPLTGTK